MREESFFEWLGREFGELIRFVVEALGDFLAMMGGAVASFIEGLSEALDITPSMLSTGVLFIGLLLLYSALRAFLRRSIIVGLVWLFLGLWLLSGLIH
jgi:hypothetical protein